MATGTSAYERLTGGNRKQRKDLQRDCIRMIRDWVWYMQTPPESILGMKAISSRRLQRGMPSRSGSLEAGRQIWNEWRHG